MSWRLDINCILHKLCNTVVVADHLNRRLCYPFFIHCSPPSPTFTRALFYHCPIGSLDVCLYSTQEDGQQVFKGKLKSFKTLTLSYKRFRRWDFLQPCVETFEDDFTKLSSSFYFQMCINVICNMQMHLRISIKNKTARGEIKYLLPSKRLFLKRTIDT